MWKWDCMESKGNTPTLILWKGERASFMQERCTKTNLGLSIKAVTWGCVWVICWKSNNGHKCIVGVHIPCTTTNHMRHQLQCGCAHPHSAKWCSMGRCVQCQHIHHDAHPLAPCVNRAVYKLHTMQRWKVELVHLTQVVVLQPYTTHGGCRRDCKLLHGVLKPCHYNSRKHYTCSVNTFNTPR